MIRDVNPDKPILIVDDENTILEALKGILNSAGIFNLRLCGDSREVPDLLRKNRVSLVLLALTMPFVSGQELLSVIRTQYPEVPVIIITGVNEVATAVECMRQGAMDYLVKAVDNTSLLAAVRRALQIVTLREENALLKKTLLTGTLYNPGAFSSFITASGKIEAVFRYVETIAPTGRTILITGETGTGKELLAESIHILSGRPGRIVKINTAGLDDTMFSDTLFGHRKGAFSGAMESRKGLIETAGEGTLFLDEIGDLNTQNQIKLLRLLESGEYYPLGSDVPKRAGCRIIAATNRSLPELSASGTFRPDLFYRLTASAVYIPPLRDRREDIPVLVRHFMAEACADCGRPMLGVSPALLEYLESLPLKGNVRELKSLIFDGISREKGETLMPESLGLVCDKDSAAVGAGIPKDCQLHFGKLLPTLKQAGDLLVEEALRRSGGNITKAAGLLGISQPALSKRLFSASKTAENG